MPKMNINGKYVKLKLVKSGDNIRLRAVSVDGVEIADGWLMEISPAGQFRRFSGVSRNCGVELDDNTKIKEKK